MTFGLKAPEGFLPVFSVDTEEEAKSLISLACQLDYEGKPYSRELARKQTFANLAAFSDKLAKAWSYIAKK